MTEWIHPSILFIFGAFLIPLLPGALRKVYIVLVPALAFLTIACVSRGTYGVYHFLGQEIVFGQVDKLSIIFALVLSITAFIGMVYALHLNDSGQHMAAFFYAGSAIGVVFAGDYFTLFIFWEIMAFASAYLVFAQRERASVEAGFRYILMHIFGGVCLLGGILLHYVDTGSFLFGPIGQDGSPAFYLILIGFLLNAAAPPLNAWLSDAYPEATVTGAVFMSAFTTKTAVYVLIRAFPGTEILIWLGVIMAFYGVIYAVIENDCRRVLAYSTISQIGYMLVGVGIGTELALNGSVSHAFNNIIFKPLLFMAAGAVIYVTGKRKLTELGGLYRGMPLTLTLYMIGALAISGLPLFSGFVSKSMIIGAASHDHMPLVVLLLTMASSGTFLYTALRLPYHMFFGKDSGIRVQEPPPNMLAGMGMAATLCLVIGIYPAALYDLLPYPLHFAAYTPDHITGVLGTAVFTAIGFVVFFRHLTPRNTISLDTDWFYRMGSRGFMWVARNPIGGYEGWITEVSNTIVLPLIHALAGVGLWIDRNVVDRAVNSTAEFIIHFSAFLRRIQTGFVQHYAAGMVAGIAIIIIIYSLIGGG